MSLDIGVISNTHPTHSTRWMCVGCVGNVALSFSDIAILGIVSLIDKLQ